MRYIGPEISEHLTLTCCFLSIELISVFDFQGWTKRVALADRGSGGIFVRLGLAFRSHRSPRACYVRSWPSGVYPQPPIERQESCSKPIAWVQSRSL
jgi:hypothetical protein